MKSFGKVGSEKFVEILYNQRGAGVEVFGGQRRGPRR
jgi:hypothetical protein